MTLRELLPVLAALAGAIVGGLVAEARSFLEGRRERRQVLRRLLFELLEMRFRVVRGSPANLELLLGKLVREKLGDDAATVFESEDAKPIVRQLVGAVRQSFRSTPVTSSYELAVEQLAPLDPFLAYRLRDLSKVSNFDAEIADYIERAMAIPEIAASASGSSEPKQLEEAMLRALHKETVEDLAAQIRTIASALGPLSRFRADRSLQRQDSPIDTSNESVDRLLNELLGRGAT